MTNYDNDILKENIQKLMKNKNITQQQLADALEMSQSNISKALSKNDKKRFTIDQLVGIAKYFKVSVDSLIGNTSTHAEQNLSLRSIAAYLLQLITNEDVQVFDYPVEEDVFDFNDRSFTYEHKNKTIEYKAFYFPSYWYTSPDASEEEEQDNYSEMSICGNQSRQYPINTFLSRFFQIYPIYKAKGLDEQTYRTIVQDLLNHLPE